MLMLRQAMKRLLGLSATAFLALGLLMFDPDSPTLISEANACDWENYQMCTYACIVTCGGLAGVPNCNPDIPEEWCAEYCGGVWGC